MEVNKQIEAFKEIIEKEYLEKLHDNLYHNKKYLEIDFNEISTYNIDLANDLLNDPEETLKAMQLTMGGINNDFNEEDIQITSELMGKIQIINLPDSCRIPVWELRKQIKQFIKLEGYISEIGDVLIRPVMNKYECPICGNIINVLRKDEFTAITEPKKCSCGKTGKFTLLNTDTVNIRKIMLEEDLMELGERQIPKKKIILLKGYLTSKEIDRIMRIGKKVIINGWLDTFEINQKTGDMDTYFIANHIEFIERGWPMIKVTKQEKKKFDKIVKKPDFINNLKQSIMPGIHGEDKIKEALLLQLIGSDNVYDKDNFLEDRGNIHVALVGPPGSGKSQSIKYIGKFWPIYRFSSAQTATGRGLIATVIQEKQLDNKWVLTPGVIPTCSGGLCSIDELDKMNKEDYGYLNNAMNDLCYDNQTEILTKEGWKLFKDLDKNEIVASLNKEGYLIYNKINRYIEQDYEGEIYHIKNRAIDLKITPNHQVYVSFNKHIKKLINKWQPFNLHKIKNLNINKLMRFKKDAKWQGIYIDYFELPSIIKKNNQHTSYYTKSVKINMNVWLEFLGWYLSEGCIHKINGIPYTTHISQCKSQEKIKAIKNCLNKLGFKYSYDGYNFNICNKQLATYLDKLGNVYTKKIPYYIKRLCRKQLKIILNTLILGDGYIERQTYGFCSSSKKLIDDVQELILKIGYSSNIHKVKMKKNIYKKTGQIIEHKFQHYKLSVNKKQLKPQINHHAKQITKDYYKGKIYCVIVPNHLIYVRRNGKPIWCGNSVHIDKAARGILDTDTAILTSLNPIGRVFVKGEDIYQQIGLPPDLLDRFDIILPMYAKAEEEDQRKIFRIGLSKRRTQEEIKPIYDKETIIKFVAYARTIKPEVSDEMARIIEDRVIKFMRPGMPQEQQQISNRIFGVIFRFIFTYARLHLRKDVTIDDLDNTMDLLVYSYQEQGLLTKDGLFDFARTERVDVTAINIHKAVMNIINELSNTNKIFPMEDIFKPLEHDYDLDKIEETIEKLKIQGEIFEPRRGYIQRL